MISHINEKECVVVLEPMSFDSVMFFSLFQSLSFPFRLSSGEHYAFVNGVSFTTTHIHPPSLRFSQRSRDTPEDHPSYLLSSSKGSECTSSWLGIFFSSARTPLSCSYALSPSSFPTPSNFTHAEIFPTRSVSYPLPFPLCRDPVCNTDPGTLSPFLFCFPPPL